MFRSTFQRRNLPITWSEVLFKIVAWMSGTGL